LSGDFKLSPDQLQRVTSQCQGTGDSLSRGMANLISEISSMPGAGAAYQALQTQSANLDEGMRKILRALDELADKMGAASVDFSNDDQQFGDNITRAAQSVQGGSAYSALSGH
jgi:uncharacterized protein YukE